MMQKAPDVANLADLYDEEYYRSHLGPVPYNRESPAIMNFFSAVAEQLVRSLNPRTVMDAGCAMGFLVEMLWDRGVEAWGVDISPYAISQVRTDIRSYCSVASLGEPLSGKYDLITCIEVLEHMPEAEAVQAIEHMARASDTILFSSSLSDFAEPTHVNVHQPMWWLGHFQRVGFAPDSLFDCTFVSPQAMLLRKTDKPPAYEVQRLFSDLLHSRTRAITGEERIRQLTAETQDLLQSLAASRGLETELSVSREQCRVSAEEVARQTEQVSQRTATFEQLSRQFSNQTEQLAASENRVAADEERIRQLTTQQMEQLAASDNRVAEGEERIRQLTTEAGDLRRALATSRALEMELSMLREQYRISAEEVVRQREQVSRLTGSEEECQRMRDEAANANDAIRSLTASREAMASQLEAVSAEVSSMRSLAERCEQRGTIFLQQIEHSEGALQELQQSVAEQSVRWDRHLSSQRAVSSSLENRCVRLAASVQSMEPRVADADLRIEELTRLHLNMHQQVNGLATQVREILHSRIWKALVNGGGLLLKFTGRG